MAIDSNLLQSKLKQFFGFDAFKGDQERIIRHLVDGGNAFVLMPTGECQTESTNPNVGESPGDCSS